jgi:predicted metal-dependent hydrolase
MGVMESKITAQLARPKITPRQNLRFKFGADIPKFWFGGDPFKTRFFDAFSLRLPGGEKFFVNCVRDFRDQITDPVLAQEVKDFTRQEGQHTMVHRDYNDHLARQGVPVAEIDGKNNSALDLFRKKLSPQTTLAMTAASEHFTALLSHLLFEHPERFATADPRVIAMYAYHGAEEIEHKSVAITVLREVAKVSERKRAMTLMFMTPMFFGATLLITNRILKVDGFSFLQRTKMMFGGLRWMFGKGGMLPAMSDHYFAYFKKDFDPWSVGSNVEYERWVAAYDASGDPLAASNAMMKMAA